MCIDRSRSPRRLGLTLIELIVVLVILVGLAGIIIPMLPNMLGRTHTSASATNLGEIAKLVQTYEQLYLKYPNNWDEMATTSGTALTYVNVATIPQTTPGTLSATNGEVAALANAGITALATMQEAPTPVGNWTATFNPYNFDASGNIATATIADGTGVLLLTAAGKAKLQLPSTGNYVLLGLGKASTMVGKGMVDAPIHFSAEDGGDPTKFYNRFVAIFKVSDTATPVDRAIMVGVAAMHTGDDGLVTVSDELAEYYGTINAGK